jgi:hypothetical protein
MLSSNHDQETGSMHKNKAPQGVASGQAHRAVLCGFAHKLIEIINNILHSKKLRFQTCVIKFGGSLPTVEQRQPSHLTVLYTHSTPIGLYTFEL